MREDDGLYMLPYLVPMHCKVLSALVRGVAHTFRRPISKEPPLRPCVSVAADR